MSNTKKKDGKIIKKWEILRQGSLIILSFRRIPLLPCSRQKRIKKQRYKERPVQFLNRTGLVSLSINDQILSSA